MFTVTESALKFLADAPQLTEGQGFVTIDIDARSKYAARKGVRIKRVSASAVGEWPRDPDHARIV